VTLGRLFEYKKLRLGGRSFFHSCRSSRAGRVRIHWLCRWRDACPSSASPSYSARVQVFRILFRSRWQAKYLTHWVGDMARAFVVLLSLMAIFASSSSNAALPDLLGLTKSIDEAINRMQAVVDQARDAALAIEAQTNKDVTDRLNKIEAIVDKTTSEIKALEAKGFTDANELVEHVNAVLAYRIKDVSYLETQFKNDLAEIIYKTECAFDKTLDGNLKDALGKIGSLLGSHQILITPPVMYEGEHKTFCLPVLFDCRITQSFPIRTPFAETYGEIRAYFLARLGGARNDTPIESIVRTYEYIGVLAKRTGCFTPGNQDAYNDAFIYYSHMARQWKLVTNRGF
jgi:hypothetical protein